MLQTPGYAFGRYRLLPGRRLLLRDGTPVPLTPRAFDVLLTLVERRDRVVSKEQLLEHVWDGAAVEEGNLTQQIFLLRRVLESSDSDEHYIATVPRRGYRFVHDVEYVAASPDPEPTPAARVSVRRRPLLALFAAFAIIGVAGYLLFQRFTSEHRGGADAGVQLALTPVTREAGVESFPSFSPDGRDFVYAAGPLDYAGETDIYVRGVGLGHPFNLTPDSPGADTQPAFSPDGTLIAFRSDRDGGGLFLMQRDGTAVRPLTTEGYNPAWSPDGREVVYATGMTMASPYTNPASGSAVWIVDIRTGQKRRVRDRAAAAPSFSPHGLRIGYWADGAIATCAPDGSGAVTAVEGRPEVYTWNPVWSPDGHYLYFSSNRNGPMHLWRVRVDERSGTPLAPAEPAPVPMPSTFAAHLAFDRSGRRLLFTSAPLTADLHRVRFDFERGEVRGQVEKLTSGSHVWVWPEPSPDGTRLAFHSGLPDRDMIYVASGDGTAIRPLPQERRARVPRWSPDGQRLAFYGGTGARADIWVIGADGRDPRPVTRSTSRSIIFPVWSPDGRMAGSELGSGGRSFIFDPGRPWDERTNLTVLPDPDGQTDFVPWSWSADGGLLAGFSRLPAGGVLVLSLATGRYAQFTKGGSTPVWLPDSRRLVYATRDSLMLLDTTSGLSRRLLSIAPSRLELAAGGGFGLSPRTGYIYLSVVARDGDIWLAAPR